MGEVTVNQAHDSKCYTEVQISSSLEITLVGTSICKSLLQKYLHQCLNNHQLTPFYLEERYHPHVAVKLAQATRYISHCSAYGKRNKGVQNHQIKPATCQPKNFSVTRTLKIAQKLQCYKDLENSLKTSMLQGLGKGVEEHISQFPLLEKGKQTSAINS